MEAKMEKYLYEYIANRKTAAILPVITKDRQIISRVIEEEDEFLVFKKPIEIIEQSCRYYGASFYGSNVRIGHKVKKKRPSIKLKVLNA